MSGKQQTPKNDPKQNRQQDSRPRQNDRMPEAAQEAAPELLPEFDSQRPLPGHSTANRLNQRALQRMQRAAGNRGVVHYIVPKGQHRIIQRVQITDPATQEVLNNTVDPTTNQFQTNTYNVTSTTITGASAGGIRYEMTRSSSGVLVNVRIKFVSQRGAAPATSAFGQAVQSMSGEQVATPVPPGQPQQLARNICKRVGSFWNGKFELVGQRRPPAGGASPDGGTGEAGTEAPAPEEVVLPVRFAATPVFDLNADAHSTVRFDAVNAAGGGNIIDAGNWYANVGTYPGGVNDTYAHEYGHLLGIPDEYSLSNPNAHALMHQISPSEGTRMDRQLDEAGKRELIMSALRPHLQSRIGAIGGEVARALTSQQAAMSRALATGLRAAWRDGSVVPDAARQVREQLEAAGQTGTARMANKVMRFEAFDNLSNITLADTVIAGELDPAAIQRIITAAFTRAANSAQMSSVNLSYTNERGTASSLTMSVDLAPAAQGASSPLNAAAATAASEAVGTPAAPGAPGAAPPVYPSNTLIGQLTAMPGAWENVGDLMETAIGNMSTEITTALNTALGSDISGSVGGDVRQLYQVLYNLVQNVSTTALQNTIRQFLDSQISPVINQQLTDLLSLIETEPSRHTRATGTGTDAAPDAPPSPALMTAATSMRTQAQQMLNPPAPTAGGQPQQNVTYTASSLMGANAAGQSLRAQQMTMIQDNFNSQTPHLRRANEDSFTIRGIGT